MFEKLFKKVFEKHLKIVKKRFVKKYVEDLI
jgi:hypothetical protein